MKILFITGAKSVDYLNDTVFNGFVKLYKDDIIDSNYQWYLSKTDKYYGNNWGRGFTVCNNLYDRSDIDRNNIEDKISQKYFDLIIYGSIHRCSDYYNLVCEKYNDNEIIILDGEDHKRIWNNFNKGIYFKRELDTTQYKNSLMIHPISFSIPINKFMNINSNKKNILAPMDPRNKSSYIYNNETDYYNQYNESFFAYTCKKAGWDCMRHYEIIAAGCLPFFDKFELCPKYTMTNWNSSLQYDINQLYVNLCNNHKKDYSNNYNKILNDFYDYAINHFKTTDAAKYILSKI